ncbi:hypothetical protein [Corynebacterium sp. HS2168-gen11]|uniref:hypothetical protein n=1 Tax=Corynebacterium sp. HS2168-gen11 TaxID=2974027 RepID=UPI00216B638B|nr:hypothetical protein [Corynebacterium sp. HS2168-gen11]MCS4536122.1 hypothetical protein [Corynebacterium sp. HS2168-gen11]
MMEKILIRSGGFLLFIAAVSFGFAGELLNASVCALAATLFLWFWKYDDPAPKTQADSAADNPTPQEVRQYRLDNPRTTIYEAVQNLKEQ